MKTHVILLLTCWGFVAQAQVKRYEITAGYGNNNQVAGALDDYFYPTNPLYLLDEAETGKSSNVKYNLSAKVYFTRHLALRLRYGHYKVKNSYFYTATNIYGNFNVRQLVTNYNPAICFNESIGRFSISTGIEFAFYKVGSYHFDFDGIENSATNAAVTRHDVTQFIMDGGKATCINNFIEFEYSGRSGLGIGTSLSYGLTYAKFGDKTTEIDSYYYPSGTYNTNSTFTYPEDKKYQKRYFSNPEISIFLLYRFGKNLDKDS